MTQNTLARVQNKLRKYLKQDLELVINENRSTMLSLHTKKKRLSMHKMFLDAPEHVIAAIAHYVRGTRKDAARHNLVLRGYIQENLGRFDLSDRLDASKLVQKGRNYDLKLLYDALNQQYFGGELNISLTWFGSWGRKNKSRITFGQFYDHLRLIKIHRILDDPFFPEFFVQFIMYHEMVHAVVPGHVDDRGRYCAHGKAFKERERQFRHYEEAIMWEKKNKPHFFRG